jgi:23S rRNA (pseudouridine1915-N3)-methyltransferase
MKWRIVAIGKPALAYARDGIAEYQARLSRQAGLEFRWVKPGADGAATARRQLAAAAGAHPVLLDEHGREFTTRQLAAECTAHERAGVKCLALIIGGADGHPAELAAAVPERWSLSRLTLQHELALLVLMEQLYRLESLRRGEAYHRD